MSDAYLKNVVEAALLAAARPVSVSELLQIFELAAVGLDHEARPAFLDQRVAIAAIAAIPGADVAGPGGREPDPADDFGDHAVFAILRIHVASIALKSTHGNHSLCVVGNRDAKASLSQ